MTIAAGTSIPGTSLPGIAAKYQRPLADHLREGPQRPWRQDKRLHGGRPFGGRLSRSHKAKARRILSAGLSSWSGRSECLALVVRGPLAKSVRLARATEIGRAPRPIHLPIADLAASILALTASRLKLAPFCMGGNSMAVMASLATCCWTKTKRQNSYWNQEK